MKIITTAVIKGGTGKSTTSAALAQAAVSTGKKVLAIDLDPQANLTMFLNGNQDNPGSLALLQGVDFAQCIQQTEQGIDLISGSPQLSIDRNEFALPDNYFQLAEILKPIKDNYDYIFIDTPPTMGKLTFFALYACTDLLIPLETDVNATQGLKYITGLAHAIQEEQKAQQAYKTQQVLNVLGVILTRFDGRARLNRMFRENIEKICTDIDIPFLGYIRPGIAIREAQTLQKSVYDYASNSNPAVDYMKVFDQIK